MGIHKQQARSLFRCVHNSSSVRPSCLASRKVIITANVACFKNCTLRETVNLFTRLVD